jgi:hypothetical protein
MDTIKACCSANLPHPPIKSRKNPTHPTNQNPHPTRNLQHNPHQKTNPTNKKHNKSYLEFEVLQILRSVDVAVSAHARTYDYTPAPQGLI